MPLPAEMRIKRYLRHLPTSWVTFWVTYRAKSDDLGPLAAYPSGQQPKSALKIQVPSQALSLLDLQRGCAERAKAGASAPNEHTFGASKVARPSRDEQFRYCVIIHRECDKPTPRSHAR